MKQVRFLLAALLLMVCGIMAHAQKVVVYKHDGTKVEYASSDVKDVKYKKAYYYYAGWTCPKNLTELANCVNNQDGKLGVDYQAGSTNSIDDINLDMTNKSYSIIGDDDMEEALNYYVVIPEGISIWDSLGNNITTGAFNTKTDVNITGYNIYVSKGTFWDIKTIILHK